MFICKECGYGSASFLGKCPNCGAWNSLTQRPDITGGKSNSSQETQKLNIVNLAKIPKQSGARKSTGLFEFDRVIGGGFVPGEVVLLTGEPGVGKSTLLLQTLAKLKTLYISGEEAAEQVHDRATRLKINLANLSFSDTLQVEGIIQGIDDSEADFDVLVLDSIQTVYSNQVEGVAGSVSQIRGVTQAMVNFAKSKKIVVLLIGHVTKEGEAAGPKTLEHYVDCVLSFEGERVSNFRILRAGKNRFGTTDEIGIFEMVQGGLQEVKNPLAFLEGVDEKVAGRVTAAVAEGTRPLFFEVQTLIVSSALASPRRVVKGVNYSKVLLLLAVIQKQLHLPMDRFDVYINVVGGVTIGSPASDLAIVASVYSAFKNIAVAKSMIFTGEVGLLGEIRPGPFEEKTLSESRRLKFKQIYSSKNLKNIRDFAKIFPTEEKKLVINKYGRKSSS